MKVEILVGIVSIILVFCAGIIIGVESEKRYCVEYFQKGQ
jgi:hypothetical protein